MLKTFVLQVTLTSFTGSTAQKLGLNKQSIEGFHWESIETHRKHRFSQNNGCIGCPTNKGERSAMNCVKRNLRMMTDGSKNKGAAAVSLIGGSLSQEFLQ